jgi:hypothetical protein
MMQTEGFPASLFWDTDPAALDRDRHRNYMIERVLQYGRPPELGWLFRVYSTADVVETIRQSRNLDRKTVSFWAIHFGVPIQEFRCFQKPSPRAFST